MLYGNSKRIVVVRDIPSNVIEEAIFILKSEPSVESDSNKKVVGGKKEKANIGTDYLLKEAESIINSYITENKLIERYPHKKLIKNTVKLSKKQTNWIINGTLICSIALLIFVISRFL